MPSEVNEMIVVAASVLILSMAEITAALFGGSDREFASSTRTRSVVTKRPVNIDAAANASG